MAFIEEHLRIGWKMVKGNLFGRMEESMSDSGKREKEMEKESSIIQKEGWSEWGNGRITK